MTIFLILLSFLFAFPATATEPHALFDEALAMKNEGRLEEAENQFKKVLEFEPVNSNAHFELANVYALEYDDYTRRDPAVAAEKLELAARELQQAVMYNPDFIAAQFNLGIVYKKQGKYAEAREAFKKVAQLVPQDINARMEIGMTYEEQGFYEEARTAYREAQEIQPVNPDVQNALIQLDKVEAKAQDESLRAPLPSSNMGPYAYAQQQANGYGDPQQPQNSSIMQQAAPILGQMLMKQFMKPKSQDAQASQ